MKKIAIYPGTFDPVTKGHLDLIDRATKMFDKVIVAVSISKDKTPMFDHSMRIKMLKEATKEFKNVEIEEFDTLLVDFVNSKKSNIIVRGLRAVSDFEFELQMGYANSSLSPNIETVYLMPSLQYAFISSSIVRSILQHNGDASHLVPKEVLECI